MKRKTSMHCLLLSALLVSGAMAQARDSLLSRRFCDPNKSTQSTQWVALGEIGDTTALIAALREAASGDLRAVWIQQSSGDYWVDKLALDVVQNSRWLPPLVGSRAAPTVDRISVGFRDAQPRFP
jgi:hypothetical protein